MKRILIAAALGAALIGAGACRSPLGGTIPAPGGGTGTRGAAAAPGGGGDFCATIEAEAQRLADKYGSAPESGPNIDLLMGAGDDLAEVYSRIAAVAPPEIKDDFDRVAAAMSGAMDLDASALEDLTNAMPTIASYVAKNCGEVELPEL